MFAAEGQARGAVVIMEPRLFPIRTPASLHGRRQHTKIGDRPVTDVDNVKTPPAQEGEMAMIEYIPIQVADAEPRGSGAHETIQGFFKEESGRGENLVSQVAAY